MNENEAQIRAIVDKLGEKREPFLAEVESAIKAHISGKSWQECLTIVELYPGGSVHLICKPEASKEYVKHLMAFVQEKRCNGYTLDSRLTNGVVELVTKKFEHFYESNTNALAEPLVKQLMNDGVFVKQLRSQLVDSTNNPIGTEVKSRLMEKLIESVQDSTQTNISHVALEAVQTVTGKIVAAASAVPISNAVMMVIIKNVALMLKGVIAKILASTAFKAAAAAMIKKLVAVKIIAVLIGLVGPALGSVSIVWIVAPLVFAFIAYEVSHLPENMGIKISNSVVAELRGEFDKMNQKIATQILKNFTSSAVSSLASSIAQDPDFKKLITGLAKH